MVSMRKALLVIPILVILIGLGTYSYFLFIWIPKQMRVSFENHYLSIMKNLNSTEKKTGVRAWFERYHNFTELYEWVHMDLEFVPPNETFTRYTDPFEIKEHHKGRCEEFSILYVAICLAHNYQSRLIVAIDVGNPTFWIDQHVWAEVKLENRWVHVDPSDRRWDEPFMYRNWEWGRDIGSKIKIYAFEDEKCGDVTLYY